MFKECKIKDCDSLPFKHEARGYCNKHYRRLLNAGSPLARDGRRQDVPIGMRRCFECRKILDISSFYKDRSFSTGYAYRCKSCMGSYDLEKRQVRQQTRNHIKTGPNCQNCNTTDRLEKHHPDYSKPYEILTLCRPCHMKVHYKGLVVIPTDDPKAAAPHS